MGRRILACFVALALIFALPVFSFSAGESISLKDSGSPTVSLMSMSAIAADEGISLAAAEGNSGQFGFDFRPYEGDLKFSESGIGSSGRFYNFYYTLPAGRYYIDATFSDSFSSFGSYMYPDSSVSIVESRSITGNSVRAVINVPQTGRVGGSFGVPSGSSLPSASFIVDFKVNTLKPVEGISCGYTFNSGVKDDDDISARLDLATWDFGSQPAGNYIINIYTYGQNYDVDFDIAVGSDITQDRKVAVAKSNGLYTCLISHAGGNLVLDANFTYKKSTLNSPDIGSGSVSGSLYEGSGSVYGTFSSHFVSSGNWIFNITDVVAVPLDGVGLEQFGVFGPMIGFLRDGFSSIKSNVVNQFTQLKTSLVTEFTNLKSSITTQFTQLKTQLTTQYNGMKTFIEQQVTRIVGDDDTESDVQSAADELNKEVQDLQSLSGDLNTQSSNLQQQFATDFAIPDELSSNSNNIQLIFSFIFSTFGIYTIFIWLPVVLAVIKKLLRL